MVDEAGKRPARQSLHSLGMPCNLRRPLLLSNPLTSCFWPVADSRTSRKYCLDDAWSRLDELRLGAQAYPLINGLGPSL